MHTDLFPETLLVETIDAHSYTTSLKVAEHFRKNHRHVLGSIQRLNEPESGLIGDFFERNFSLSAYVDSRGRSKPAYRLTRNGFSILAMGFTGAEAMGWKQAFLEAFNNSEAQLRAVTERYAAALDQVRPMLRPVVEGTQRGLRRTAIGAPLGKSPGSVTYHRGAARRLGLLVAVGG